ncbi:MAG: hypothetical protein Q4Q03_00425 [Bowdeniella nasicola]|nr:hypothetical protein [Bowdeniella nasicola]
MSGLITGNRCGRAVLIVVLWALVLPLLLATPANAMPSGARAPRDGASGLRTADTPSGDTIVFVGLGALRWRDISAKTTPNLWALMHGEHTGAGSLVVRTVEPLTCPAEAWLTLAAGQRVTTGAGTPCHPLADFRSHMGWQELRRINDSTHYGAELGLLAQTLGDHRVEAAAIGPGATLALTAPSGVQAAKSYPDVVASSTIANQTADLIAGGDARILLIDAASGADDVTGLTTGALPHPSPADLVISKRIDTRLGAVISGLQRGLAARGDASNVRIFLSSMHDRYSRPFLHFYGETTITATTPVLPAPAGNGAGTAPLAPGGSGTITPPHPTAGNTPAPSVPLWESDPVLTTAASASTRQVDLAQTTDLLPTLLDRLDIGVPNAAIGTPIALGTTPTQLRALQAHQSDIDQHIDRSRAALPLLYPLYVLTVLALIVVAAQLLRLPRLREVEAGTHAGLAWWASVPIAVPLGVYLVDLLPWWRLDGPLIGADAAPIIGALGGLGLAAILAAIALLIPRIPAIALLSGALWCTLIGDTLTGSALQRTAIMGSFATVGGRFYGINNTAFTLLLVCSLIVAATAASQVKRKWRVWTVAAIGTVTIAVDGAPMWGADFGGPPALLPAFLLLGLLVAGVAITWRRILLIMVATGGVMVSLAVADWLRPETERTHLGHLVTITLNGELAQVLLRKVAALAEMAFSWQALALFGAIILMSSLILRGILVHTSPENAVDNTPGLRAAAKRSWRTLRAEYREASLPPFARAGATAITIGLLLGFALNDSGPAILALGGAVGISSYLSFTHERLMRAPETPRARVDDSPLGPAVASARGHTRARR